MKGSICEYRDKWRAYIDIPSENGERKRKTKVSESKEELERWLTKIRYKLNEDVYIEPAEMELAEYLETWFERKKEGVRPSTADKYRYAMKKLKGKLGGIPLDQLIPYHIQDTYKELKDELSQNTVVIIANVLEMAMKKAEDEKLLKESPCRSTEKPARENKEMNYLTPEEVGRFLDQVNGEWPYECLYKLAIATGLRRCELMGLKWDDVKMNEGEIRVVRQLSIEDGWNFEFRELKTEASKRRIAISEDTIEVLKKHRQKQLKRKLQAQEWPNDELVLTTEKGEHLKPSFWKKHLKKRLNQAECKEVSMHELRHTCATLLLSEGVQPKIVQEILGHSSISTTLDVYAHVIPGQQEESAEKIGKIINS